MAEYSQKWHNGTSPKTISTETSDGLAAIQAQLNSLRREIKKVNEKVYVAQVGCELCKGPHYPKDCPLKEEEKTLEEASYTQFGTPYQLGGKYRVAGPGFYQCNNRNSSYSDRRQTLETHSTVTYFLKRFPFPDDYMVSAMMIGRRMDQDDEFEPTLDFVNEPTYKDSYKMKFSCMIRYKHVIADFLPTLSINMMTKSFYNSIIKDKGAHEGKNLAGTLIDIPIFVRNFSIISGFSIIDDIDLTSGVVLGMPFCKKFVSCQMIMERFAHMDEYERMDDDE
nr:hypothetical protein [Tanacetum cinerariifolium]